MLLFLYFLAILHLASPLFSSLFLSSYILSDELFEVLNPTFYFIIFIKVVSKFQVLRSVAVKI